MARLAGHRRQRPEPDEPADEPSDYEQRMLELAESQEEAQWHAARSAGRIRYYFVWAIFLAIVAFLIFLDNR